MKETNRTMTEILNEAMQEKCTEHIQAGEFCAAFELIQAAKSIKNDDPHEAQGWLTDYQNNFDGNDLAP